MARPRRPARLLQNRRAVTPLTIDLRLPLPGAPLARFVSSESLDGAKLLVGGEVLIEARTSEELAGGVCVTLEPRDEVLVLRATRRPGRPPRVSVRIDGRPAVREASTRPLARHTRACLRALRKILRAS